MVLQIHSGPKRGRRLCLRPPSYLNTNYAPECMCVSNLTPYPLASLSLNILTQRTHMGGTLSRRRRCSCDRAGFSGIFAVFSGSTLCIFTLLWVVGLGWMVFQWGGRCFFCRFSLSLGAALPFIEPFGQDGRSGYLAHSPPSGLLYHNARIRTLHMLRNMYLR